MILKQTESHVMKMIFLNGDSTLVDTIILLVTPIYVELELKATPAIIGVAMSLIVVLQDLVQFWIYYSVYIRTRNMNNNGEP